MKPKILGINDDVTTCECCGKSNLKKTVVLDFGGSILHYGETCAVRAHFPHLKNGKLARRAEAAQTGRTVKPKQMVVKNGVVFWSRG